MYLLLYMDSPVSPGLESCSRTGVSPLLWGEEEAARSFSRWWKTILGLPSKLPSSCIRQRQQILILQMLTEWIPLKCLREYVCVCQSQWIKSCNNKLMFKLRMCILTSWVIAKTSWILESIRCILVLLKVLTGEFIYRTCTYCIIFIDNYNNYYYYYRQLKMPIPNFSPFIQKFMTLWFFSSPPHWSVWLKSRSKTQAKSVSQCSHQRSACMGQIQQQNK